MTIKGNGRSALILTTGLLVCFATPLQAAGADDATTRSKSGNPAAAPVKLHQNLRYGAHHRKSYAHRKWNRVALKTADRENAGRIDVADSNGEALPAIIPPSVANANAQLALPGMPGGTAEAMAARANDLLQAAPDNRADAKTDVKADNRAGHETLVVAADQLNDVDRTLREGDAPAANTVVAPAANTVVASADPSAAPVVAGSQESSTWDQTSLIGKIFIGFGALLTMASAARMFMA
jgi:hypothetical protein